MPTGTIPAKHNPMAAVEAANRAAFTIGSEAANVINVSVQLQKPRKTNVAQRVGVFAYLSDDANGDSVVATGVDTLAIGTNGVLAGAVTAGKSAWIVSEVTGVFDLNLTFASGAKTCYLVLVMPDGSLVVSSAITFA